MPLDAEVAAKLDALREQISSMAESVNAQFRSITSTIGANHIAFEGRMTAMERDLNGHEALDAAIVQQLHDVDSQREAEIVALAAEQGKDRARVEGLEKLTEQAKGAAWAWRVIIGGAVACLGILEAWLHGGRHP